MNALKLLTGLFPFAASASGFSSAFKVNGKGGGTALETDFFLRRKKVEDFFVTIGWFSLLAEASVVVFTPFVEGVLSIWTSSGTGVDRPCVLFKL
jgi:hypothetical protein